MLVAVAVMIVVICFQIVMQYLPAQNFAFRMLGFCIGFPFGIIVHELGHVTAGLIAKFSVLSFAVGPFTLRRQSGNLIVRIAPFRVGGMITAVPLHSNNLRRRMLLLTAGGPVASLLGGGFEFGLGLLFHPAAWSSWMFPLAVMSWVVGVISLMPTRGFYTSDGVRILDLLRESPESERLCAVLSIAACAIAGIRPSDWDLKLVEKARSAQERPNDNIVATLMAYEFAMDSHHFDDAETYLQSAIQQMPKCPPNIKSGIAADAAFYNAVIRNDAKTARDWLNQCDPQYFEDGYVLPMVEAAVLIAEGQTQEADTKLDMSNSLLGTARFPGFALAAQGWIADMRERIRTTAETLPALSAEPGSAGLS